MLIWEKQEDSAMPFALQVLIGVSYQCGRNSALISLHLSCRHVSFWHFIAPLVVYR